MLIHAGVSVRMVRPVLAGLASHGIDPQPLLEAVRLDPAVFADPDARIPHPAVVELWTRATEATGDSAFGLHVAEGIDVSMFDVQGYCLVTSETLGAGLERVIALHRINHDAAQMTLTDEDGGRLWTHVLPNNVQLPRQPAEFLIAASIVAARQATDSDIRPLSVRFRHEQPDDVSAHTKLFGCPVRFECERNAILFRTESMALACRKADPLLLGVLERHAKELIAKMPAVDTFVSRVRALLSEELRGGNPNAENIAESLGMSVRTLSRRLVDHGTSHKKLLDHLRRELCDSYMRDQRLGVADIGFLLGFGDASSFHRAFKRWHSQTPADYRRSQPK